MKKNEFIRYVTDGVIQRYPAWAVLWEQKRSYTSILGRQLPQTLVYLRFDCRPDRYWFGHGVGWAPNLGGLVAEETAARNPEFKHREGRLARIRTLGSPKDFTYEAHEVSTGSLARPYSKYSLEDSSPEQLRAAMLQEIEDLAMPYLCLMLANRHGLTLTPDELGKGLP